MKLLHNISRLHRTAWLLPIFLLIGCPSGEKSHEGHNHESGEEQDHHGDESADEHAGHDHDEEGSK